MARQLHRYSHAMPTMPTEAMGRLDAILGQAPLDAPAQVQDRAPEPPKLWLDGELSTTAQY